MDDPPQQVALQTYIDAERPAGERVAQLTGHLMRALPEWSLAPMVDSLVALRGIDTLAAIVLLAELGDISRFDSPKQLMAFLGLVPSEHSSGGRRRQGAITLTGNTQARRVFPRSSRRGATASRRARPSTSKPPGLDPVSPRRHDTFTHPRILICKSSRHAGGHCAPPAPGACARQTRDAGGLGAVALGRILGTRHEGLAAATTALHMAHLSHDLVHPDD